MKYSPKDIKEGDLVTWDFNQEEDSYYPVTHIITDGVDSLSKVYHTMPGGEEDWGYLSGIVDVKKKQEVIEIGDIIYLTDYIGENEYTVYEVQEDRYITSRTGNYILKKDATLYKKAPKEEIIGYELLKELPGYPQGATTHELGLNPSGWYFGKYFFNNEEIKDRNWFKPIYKKKEIVVEISGGRTITIDKQSNKLYLDDKAEFCSTTQYTDIRSKALKSDIVQTGRRAYSFEITQFKIGCIVFNKEDFHTIDKALNS